MSLFSELARGLSGSSGSSQRTSSSGSYSQSSNLIAYQCQYCGDVRHVASTYALPNGGTGCRARGKDSHGKPLNHVWKQM